MSGRWVYRVVGRRPRTAGALPIAVIALSALGAAGQGEYYERERTDFSPRWNVGGSLAFVSPQGEFADFVDGGFGASLRLVYGLDPSGIVGLRFDAGYINYGSERFTTPLLPATGRILVDVTTRNNIAVLGIGPQLQVPRGPLRPYVNGFIGLGYFFTETSVGGSSNFDPDGFARTLNFDDASFGYGGGGGLALTFGRPWRPVSINLEVQYRRHGETEYLREGSILDDGFGGVVITPLLSEADFLMFQVGASVGL